MAKKVIKITEGQLRDVVKESVKKALLENIASNAPYFSTHEEFESFFEETDKTTEFYYLSKEKTGLNVDFYIDDCSSYKRHNHPLWAYFCNGYSHNEQLIPISISYKPIIEIANCSINIPSIDISSIVIFIKQNINALQNIADENIDSVELLKNITKFQPRFYVAEASAAINEMAKIEDAYSNLGFNIFIDATPRNTNHNDYRLKYPINKEAEQGNNSNNFTPMSISENPEFLPPNMIKVYNAKADMKRKAIMQDFIRTHYKELQAVYDGILDLNTYKLMLQAETHSKQ